MHLFQEKIFGFLFLVCKSRLCRVRLGSLLTKWVLARPIKSFFDIKSKHREKKGGQCIFLNEIALFPTKYSFTSLIILIPKPYLMEVRYVKKYHRYN